MDKGPGHKHTCPDRQSAKMPHGEIQIDQNENQDRCAVRRSRPARSECVEKKRTNSNDADPDAEEQNRCRSAGRFLPGKQDHKSGDDEGKICQGIGRLGPESRAQTFAIIVDLFVDLKRLVSLSGLTVPSTGLTKTIPPTGAASIRWTRQTGPA